MSNTVQNGKGDKARNNYSEQFRQNYDFIFGKSRAARGLKEGGRNKAAPSNDVHASDENGATSKNSFTE